MPVDYIKISKVPAGTKAGLKQENPDVPPRASFIESNTGRRKTNKHKTLVRKWNELSYENSDYRLSEFPDIVAALTEIGNERATILLDADVHLSSGQKLVFPPTLSIKRAGYMFYAPFLPRVDETDPLSYPVALTDWVENIYTEVYFHGPVTQSEDQWFSGDMLVWFKRKSVKYIRPEWWGIIKGNNSTLAGRINTRAFYYSAISIIENRNWDPNATSILAIGSNNIYIGEPIVFGKYDIENHPFLTGKRVPKYKNLNGVNVIVNDKPVETHVHSTMIKIIGAEKIKHEVNYGSTTNIFYNNTYASPFIVLGGRNIYIENIRFKGLNKTDSKDSVMLPALAPMDAEPQISGQESFFYKLALRPDSFVDHYDVLNGIYGTYDPAKNGWISNNINWGRWKPYAGIITDPFSVNYQHPYAPSRVAYEYGFKDTYLELYYGDYRVDNSMAISIENCYFSGFVSAICQTLTEQMGDTFIYRNLMFEDMVFGISTCQDQSRDCTVYDCMAYNTMHTAFEQVWHGRGVGAAPEIMKFHSAGGIKYIMTHGNTQIGKVNINNIYAEYVYSLGYSLDGRHNFTSSVSNCAISRVPAKYIRVLGTVDENGVLEKGMIPRPKDLERVTFYNCFLGSYVGEDHEAIVDFMGFDNCLFFNCTYGPRIHWFPFDVKWLGHNPSSSNTTIGSIYSLNPEVHPIPKARTFDLVAGYRGLFKDIPLTDFQQLHNLYIGKGTYRVYRDIYTIKVNNTGGKTSDLASVKLYDIVKFDTHSFYKPLIGVVFEQAEDKSWYKVGGFNLEEWNQYFHADTIDGNGQLLNTYNSDGTINNPAIVDANVFAMTFSYNFTEFNGSTAVGSDVITVNHKYLYNGSSTALIAGAVIRMPDGSYSRIKSLSGNDIVLTKPYHTTVNNFIFEPSPKGHEVTGFHINENTGGNFSYSAFYKRGSWYDRYSPNGTLTGRLRCVRSGDFSLRGVNPSGINYQEYRAAFLEYDLDNNLIGYISNIQPASGSIVTPVLHSGTTAQRPNAPAVPLPVGFVYKNTDTNAFQKWSGSEWYV